MLLAQSAKCQVEFPNAMHRVGGPGPYASGPDIPTMPRRAQKPGGLAESPVSGILLCRRTARNASERLCCTSRVNASLQFLNEAIPLLFREKRIFRTQARHERRQDNTSVLVRGLRQPKNSNETFGYINDTTVLTIGGHPVGPTAIHEPPITFPRDLDTQPPNLCR